ncbi:MAG TPA: FG-GAP repeat protein [Mycobacteriales bacterium]|nr:FG-GAP repeat protein [Mycobacteriales bacterium]
MGLVKGVVVVPVAMSMAAFGLAAAAPPAAADVTIPTINCPASGSSTSLVDFDGDGVADAVVAVPGANGGMGAIEVRYSRGTSTTTFSPGDGVIPAVTAAGPPLTFATLDANYDGCTDLAIGIPSYTDGGVAAAGAVQLLYGSKDGFVTGPLITPSNASLPGDAQAGEHFGYALAGLSNELTVGAPGWSPTVSGAQPTPRAGEAIAMRFDYYQQSGFDNVWAIRKSFPHAGDRLGTVVAPSIAAAPTATGHGKNHAGCIAWSTSTADVGAYCGHHDNDRLGASLSYSYVAGVGYALFAGAPTHEVAVTSVVKHGKHKGKKVTRTVKDAGVVEQFALIRTAGSPTLKLEATISQGSPRVPGDPTKGNEFGSAITTFNGKKPLLAISAPGAKVNGHAHAGAVFLRVGAERSSPWQLIDRDVKGVASAATTGDRFGTALSLAGRGYPGTAIDFVLYVGVPNDSVGGNADAGRVQIFYGAGSKPRLTGSKFLTEHGGGVAHAQYGAAVD